ncbi:MAG: class B sortase [Firmicutes bacterium]|nr:class B sortase [Bacillota bacterium]
MKKAICAVLAIAMLAVMGYSGAKLLALDEEIKAERRLHIELLEKKPGGEENPLARLREENPDIIGWITVPYTNIDYPIVQGKDNSYYLRRDLNGEPARPGTIFMDYRCDGGGAGFSVVYGHNMKSGAMFGTLKRYEDKAFLAAHPEGKILFEDGWHTLRFFDFRVVNEKDSLYDLPKEAGGERVVALSTCSYAFQGARMVLLGKIT